MRKLLTLLIAASTLPLFGCPNGGVDPPPELLEDPKAVLDLMHQRLAPLKSVAIVARASYYGEGGSKKGTTILLGRRPASVRFDALTPTDELIATLASDGRTFVSFERGAKTCDTGPSCPANLSRMLPLRMEGADILTALLGGAPVIRHKEASVAWDRDAGAYRVRLVGDDATERIWIAPKTGVVKKADLIRGGKTVLTLTFDDFEQSGGHWLPRELHFEMDEPEVDLKIKYREVDLNVDLEDDAFAIQCPEGTTTRQALCPEPWSPPAP